MTNPSMDAYREFLKDSIRMRTDFSRTDQNQGLAPPPVEKPYRKDQELIALPKSSEWTTIPKVDLTDAIARRRSRRRFQDVPLTIEELAFLLWATQGLRGSARPGAAYRTVPSAGCRHTFETYLCVLHVKDLDAGIYRYLPVEHALVLEHRPNALPSKLSEAALFQEFTAQGAVTFIWTTIPARMEWRYGAAAHKVIAVDAGHVCQNLYLACEAIGAGTCAVGAYNQAKADALVQVDGQDEFVIYLAPVGKVSR